MILHIELVPGSDPGAQAKLIGQRLSRLRKARRLLQSEVALRAGMSRPTLIRIEAGDPRQTLDQILRYLHAVAPGMSLLELLQETDPSLRALAQAEATRRVRTLSESELKSLDF